MPIEQLTVWPTEADLEAALPAALRRAFPWLATEAIQHQTKFSFTCGRSQIHIDGKAESRSTARADILLYSGQQPLAVMELKRPGHSIDKSDIEQGLSYARMLHPRPPLVLVTNGHDLTLLETHTGTEWNPAEPSEVAFANLMKTASHVAITDLKRAISTLMGSSPSVWVQAIRQTSVLRIDELSGAWDEHLLPFVPGFLIPRKATSATIDYLRRGKRLVLIEGPPLSGKSNVLRDLTTQTENAEDIVVLFVEAESGSGIFQGIAGTLSDALSWPVTRDEARDWLRGLSNSTGPSLVIAVDGLGIDRDDIRIDVEDLTSHQFGGGVRVVMTLDDSLADRVVKNSTGRKSSPIGRRANRVTLASLDDDEFERAVQVLWNHRVAIMNGGESSPELRLLWVLRSVVSRSRVGQRNLTSTLSQHRA